jgi:hypothetical protein
MTTTFLKNKQSNMRYKVNEPFNITTLYNKPLHHTHRPFTPSTITPFAITLYTMQVQLVKLIVSSTVEYAQYLPTHDIYLYEF